VQVLETSSDQQNKTALLLLSESNPAALEPIMCLKGLYTHYGEIGREPGKSMKGTRHRSMTVLDGRALPCFQSSSNLIPTTLFSFCVRLGITLSDSRSGFANCQQGSVGENTFRVRAHTEHGECRFTDLP
jgi:hypothetical protein